MHLSCNTHFQIKNAKTRVQYFQLQTSFIDKNHLGLQILQTIIQDWN